MKSPFLDPSKTRSRYGTLRPYAELEVTVRMGTLWGYAHRQGWMIIHPYSKHYDGVLAYRFSQGGLTVEELRQHAKQHITKNKKI
jgi:hypothetical protein